MRIIVVIFITVLSSFVIAKTSSDFEFSCRIKAKEIAAENYRSCIMEKKTLKIEKLRQEYGEEMRALKEKFEKKISKLGGKFQKHNNQQNHKTKKSTESSINSELEQEEDKASSSEESSLDIPEPIPVEKDI